LVKRGHSKALLAWTSRLRALFRRKKLAQELDEELEFHLSLRRQWTADRGLAAVTARARGNAALRPLGGHLKSGHTWSLQNRPTELAEDLMILPSLGRFERRHLLADDFAYVPCYLW
jgi:hypothetical protein